MARDLRETTRTDLTTTVEDYSVATQNLDSPQDQDDNFWTNPNFAKNLGYYKTIPELKKAIDNIAIWSVGKGYDDSQNAVPLSTINGWGEDSFQSIMQNMITMKKISGDAFAEIVRNDKGTLINLKPLNPGNIRIVVGKNGIIKRYDQLNKLGKVNASFKPEEIFHISNDRVGDEIHGVSVVDACLWVINARHEAMTDWRRILHRSTIRVMYIDSDDTTKLTQVKTQYADAINKGEVMVVPAKRGGEGGVEFEDLVCPPVSNFLEWIRYLEGFFYQAVGIPRVIATSENFTESNGKVGFLTFEPIYTNEQSNMENDLFNQLGIKITFNRPPSLSGIVAQSEKANTGQTGFQPSEMQVGMTRNE